MGKTRAAYPPEFRCQMVDLVRAGRSPEELAREFRTDGTIDQELVGTVPAPSPPPSIRALTGRQRLNLDRAVASRRAGDLRPRLQPQLAGSTWLQACWRG
jgi:hypothetical protein